MYHEEGGEKEAGTLLLALGIMVCNLIVFPASYFGHLFALHSVCNNVKIAVSLSPKSQWSLEQVYHSSPQWDNHSGSVIWGDGIRTKRKAPHAHTMWLCNLNPVMKLFKMK
ncbi:unnamed protein product [Linum trigynum]|uniref:Uncharacterized protein n=1 Tax=Linum trigynum TaxID=586398 RepID=A0AAV2E0Y4_9ROSI